MSVAPPDTIHFNQSYLDYHYEWNGFPTVLAIVPWIYMIPTIVIVYRICAIYFKNDWDLVEPGKNQYVFLVICLTQISCVLFFWFNYLLSRLPATGWFTSFCAGIAPNKWLLTIPFFASYTCYMAMIYPFFMPIARLIIMAFPKNHNQINSIMMRIAVPVGIIYPICFTFFLIPATGTCKQLEFPYPYGSIWIYYYGQAFGLRNTPFLLANISFWLVLSIIANAILLVKIARAKRRLITKTTSNASLKSQESINYTTIAMIVFYIVNGFSMVRFTVSM